MKKIILTLSLAISLLSCSTESLDVNPEAAVQNDIISKATTKKIASVTSVAFTIPNSIYNLTAYTSCDNNCIAKDSDLYFEKTDQKIVTWGGGPSGGSSKTIYIKYFNTPTHFVLQVLSTNGYSDLVIDGVPSGIKADANTWGTYTYPLKDGWKKCDTESFALQVAGDGPQGVFNVSYNLIGLCPEVGCENTFTGKAIACGTSREAEYTFTSKADISDLKIQGGLTNFTGSDAIVTITGGTLIATQVTPGGSSNRVITVTGSVIACEPIKINIKWNSTNSGGVITGSWSASGTGIAVDPILGLTCN